MPHFTHVEISTTDLEKSRGFYAGLFGWEVEEVMETYWMLSTGATPGGGLNLVEELPETGPLQVYVTVDSIDDALARAGELGGRTILPKTGIGDGFGSYAHVREPGGAVIGLHQNT